MFPDILKSARDHRPSQRLLQQPPVLIILCIDVQFIVLLDGSAQSRGAGARLAGKREFPKGDRPAFREVARRIPPTSPSGRHPPGARASRPHAVPSVAAQFPCDIAADRPAGGNRMGPAEAEAGRRCRSNRVEEMAEAAGGFVRAGRPRSRGASSHDRVTPTGQKCRSILASVVVEGGPSVLVPETKPVSPSFDPHRRGGTGGRLNTCVAAAEPAQERYIMGAGLARKG